MNRRGFLKSILAAGFAPAVVGSGILMPVRQLIVPSDSIAVIGVDLAAGQDFTYTFQSELEDDEIVILFREVQNMANVVCDPPAPSRSDPLGLYRTLHLPRPLRHQPT